MEMGVDGDDVCMVDTGLVLGLGMGRHSPSKQDLKLSPSFQSSNSMEPSLTLGRQSMVEENVEVKSPSSPQSLASSLSNGVGTSNVKRERDVDIERVSSRISDEDEEGSAKKKLRLTKEQSALLEERFKEHSTLNPKQKLALAKQLHLRPRQVEVWFQNRRARTKLKQTEVDCEFLKRCCETLTDENRKLHKELQQLRSLKMSATPFYSMQIPTATLTMCPSCERISSGSSSDNSKENSTTTFMVPQKPHFYNHITHSPSAAC